jgi:hypothetical protein
VKQPFADPDPFHELTFPSALDAKRAISNHLALPLAKLAPEQLAALNQSRASLCLEHLALRHQLAVYQRSVPRPRLRAMDRLFWAWLSRLWSGWQGALAFVKPCT